MKTRTVPSPQEGPGGSHVPTDSDVCIKSVVVAVGPSKERLSLPRPKGEEGTGVAEVPQTSGRVYRDYVGHTSVAVR